MGMSLTMLILASCTKKLENDSIKPESYTEYFYLTDLSTDDYLYLEVSVEKEITKSDVERNVVGNGWRSIAIYKLDQNKEIIEEWGLKDDLPIRRMETLRHCFEVKGFGQDQLIQFGLSEGRYEALKFAYDESDNSISLAACSFIGYTGTLVYLSEDVMVCVDGGDFPPLKDKSPYIYMAVFEKVSKSTLMNWRKLCPDSGLWI